jgi:hypothetical protein
VPTTEGRFPLSAHDENFPPNWLPTRLENKRQQYFPLLRSNMALLLQGNINERSSAFFGQQQVAAIPDRDLRGLGKFLQQPGQRHFQPDMIFRDVKMARSRLAQRADPENHAVLLPSFFIDFQHGNAGGRARQPRLQPAGRLFPAKTMRNRNDKRCGHDESSLRQMQADMNACNSTSFEKKDARVAKAEPYGFPFVFWQAE